MAANKANRYDGQYLAPEHLLSIGFLSPLSEYPQLKFTHRALQSKQQSIVEQTRIVDSLCVHNECFGQHTQVDQMMPVAIIASKPRRFHGQYGPDSTPRWLPMRKIPKIHRRRSIIRQVALCSD